jgi:hypothetical protein
LGAYYKIQLKLLIFFLFTHFFFFFRVQFNCQCHIILDKMASGNCIGLVEVVVAAVGGQRSPKIYPRKSSNGTNGRNGGHNTRSSGGEWKLTRVT